jgi:hypothetical protein
MVEVGDEEMYKSGEDIGHEGAICCWWRVEGDQGRDGSAVSRSPTTLGSSSAIDES